MNGSLASWSIDSAAEILPICISERVPSCIRAPPDAEKMITAALFSNARSISRVIFSPTADPIDPPMNDISIGPAYTRCPPTFPDPETIASGSPELSLACTMRSL